MTAMVVGGCFLVALLFSPFILSIPPVATAPALMLIGLMMMEGLKDLHWNKLDHVLPALTVSVMMPLTFSISEGIALGFIVYAFMMLGEGKARKVKPLTWILAAMFLLRYLWP